MKTAAGADTVAGLGTYLPTTVPARWAARSPRTLAAVATGGLTVGARDVAGIDDIRDGGFYRFAFSFARPDLVEYRAPVTSVRPLADSMIQSIRSSTSPLVWTRSTSGTGR